MTVVGVTGAAVDARAGADGTTYYRLLDSIKAFGLEQVADHDETDHNRAARDQHPTDESRRCAHPALQREHK